MNRQVPDKSYTIVGNGKVARHFMHYFDALKIRYNQWSRKHSVFNLQHKVQQTKHVLLLISDDAIEKFIEQHHFLNHKSLIHFSGTLSLDNAIGCHPLMTFAENLYDLNTYKTIPFVCDQNVNFAEIFPQLSNPHYNIEKEDRAYYHALCVIAGNFTQTLMQHTSHQLSHELKLPDDILFPYLIQNTKNFINDPHKAATGPIQRNDFTTVRKNLQSLEGNPLQGIYQTFIELTKQSQQLKRIENEY